MTINLRDGVTVGVVDPRPTPVTPTVLTRGAPGAPGLGSVTWSMGPTVATVTGGYAWRVPQACAISSVAVTLGTAGAADDVVVDLLANGTSVWASAGDRPTLIPGDTVTTAVPDTTTLAEGDLLTVDVVSADTTARYLVLVVHLTSA